MEPVILEGIRIESNEDVLAALLAHCNGDESVMAGAGYFEDYAQAVIGFTDDNRVIYSYERMARCLMERDGMTEEDACEFVDYNAVRTLPYMGRSPIIRYEDGSEEKA